jgi:hypothetical protein
MDMPGNPGNRAGETFASACMFDLHGFNQLKSC